MVNSILEQVKLICKTYSILPTKSKGQNFLINQDVITEIVGAAKLKNTDLVLEIGPGLGILTESLIKNAKKVISIELDKKLFGFLQLKFKSAKNLELINEDALKFSPQQNGLQDYKIVANLPYNITSNFLKKFLTDVARPRSMTLLIQKEVAQRVCAKAGGMSLLSVSVQLYGQPKIINLVGSNNFWPKPEVDSAVLQISEIKSSKEVDKFLSGISEKEFWRIAKIGFSSRRKQLHNNLSAGLKLSSEEVKKLLKKANFDPQVRAQSLTVADWVKLAKSFNLYLN